MSDSLDDRQKYYEGTKNLFSRFAEQRGLDIEQLKDTEVRVQLIQQLSADQFLDLMSVANAKLRGEYKRWKRDYQGHDHRAVITSGLLDSPDLEPPINSETEFTSFFDEMKTGLTKDNISFWATKLYTAIIFLHMFPDGNGRLARNAFSFLLTGEMASEEFVANRPSLIKDFCETVNVIAIQQTLYKNGCDRFKYKNIGGLRNTVCYQADERSNIDDTSENGLVSRLKFIAAKRAGIISSRAKDGNEDSVSQCFANGKVLGFEGEVDENGFGQLYILDSQPWTAEEVSAFNKHYVDVRAEWFRESIRVIDENAELSQTWLEIAISLPNPFFLKINTLLRIINALSDGENDVARNILDKDRFSSNRPDVEKDTYLADLTIVIDKKRELKDKVKKLVQVATT